MLLDECEVGACNVEVVVCSPQAFDLFGRGMLSDSCKKEHIAGYEQGQCLDTI